MPDIYILSHRQSQASCTLNSIGFATYLMANEDLLKGLKESRAERPMLLAYTQLLNKLDVLFITKFTWEFEPSKYLEDFDAFHATLSRVSGPTQIEINKFYDWLSDPQNPLRNKLLNMPAVKDNPEDDPFGLLRLREAAALETLDNPLYQEVESLIDRSDQYFQKNFLKEAKNEGLFLDELNTKFSQEELRQVITPEAQSIQLDEVYDIDDLKNSTFPKPIQITANGHATVYGCTQGEYWKFDSTGKPGGDVDNTITLATVTVYKNKQEMIQEIDNILATKQVVITTVDIALKDVGQRKDALHALLEAKLNDLGEKSQRYQEEFKLSPQKDIKTAHMESLVKILGALNIPDSFKDLQDKRDALLATAQALQTQQHLEIKRHWHFF